MKPSISFMLLCKYAGARSVDSDALNHMTPLDTGLSFKLTKNSSGCVLKL